jgi:hypothetical protein
MPALRLTPARSMASALILVSVSIGGTSPVSAQDQLIKRDSLPEFNSLRTPSSPAFVLLGVEPAAVERPNTPADLALSVLNGTNNFSALPTDYALESSPYWLLSHPNLAWSDDTVRSIPQSLLRTFTFSVATASLGTSDLPVTGLGISGRASVFSGKLSRAAVGQIQALEALLAASAARLEHRLDSLRQQADTRLKERLASATGAEEMNAAKAEFDTAVAAIARTLALSSDLDEEEGKLDSDFQDLALNRDGFFLELAGGVAWRAPRAIIDSSSLDRWGIWTTASYTLPNLSFVGLLRWLGQEQVGQRDAIDVGARFIYARDRYALSLEYAGRHLRGAGPNPDGWRLAGIINYEVRPSLWLTGTFGRDYESESQGSLLAQIGLSLDLSKQRYRPDTGR